MNRLGRYTTSGCALLLLCSISINSCFAAVSSAESEENLDQIYQTLWNFMDEGNYQSALPLAEKVVDLIPRVRHARQSEHAASFHNLALVQKQLGLFRESERNFKNSVRVFEKVFGQQGSSLIKPLEHLGSLYYQVGDYSKSELAFRRVQHIMHRNGGVNTLDQLPIVEGISRIYVATNRDRDADLQQKFYHSINEINYGEKDPRMIPVKAKYGHWLKDSGQYKEALEVFQQNLNLVTELNLGSELELVEPLREIASTMYLKGNCCPLEPLNRATDIVVRDLSIDIEDKVQALLELADMNLMKRQDRVAKQLYHQAWDLMSSRSETDSEAHAFFYDPVLLGVTNRYDVGEAYTRANQGDRNSLASLGRTEHIKVSRPVQPASSRRGGSGDERLIGAPLPLCSNHVLDLTFKKRSADLAKYHVSLEFSVDGNGQVFDVNVEGESMPSNLRQYVKNILSITRFRPRLVDGEAVNAEHIRLRQHFPTSQQQKQYTDTAVDPDAHTVYQGCLVDAVAQL